MNVRQLSFSGGEIAPALYARVDMLKYATGVKTLKNFFVMRHGGAANRSGTKLITAAKDSTYKIRLIPFIFNSSQTYVLEFGHQYMRVIKNGVLLGDPFVLTTPYDYSHLQDLKFVQSADIITITHPSYATNELKRTGDTSWTITNLVYGPTIATPTDVLSDSPGSAFTYKITAVDAVTNEESLGSIVIWPNGKGGSSTQTSTLTWTSVSGAAYYNIYKNINPAITRDIFGWIGVSSGPSFKDESYVPDSLDNPPIARLPFLGTNNRPSAVAYFQQRSVFANTNNNPEGVWTSKSALRKNFMLSTPLQNDDPVTFSLAGRQVSSVKHLLEVGGKLVLFTESGEWTVEGDAAGILTPTAINPKHFTANGSGGLAPLSIEGTALYVQARGSVVRDLFFEWESQGYRGNEVSIFAAHLFDGYTLVDSAYQQIPHSIAWFVRSDGVLLGLTYIREHMVSGWHQHTFNGTVENVCVVPEGNEDVLYLVVKRSIGGGVTRFIERMHSRLIKDIRDAVFLDCSLSFDGRGTGGRTMTISGGTTWAYDEDLILTASSAFFNSNDVGNEIWILRSDGTTVIRCRIQAYTSTTVVTVKPNKTVPPAYRSVPVTTWSKAVDQVSGLSNLEGETVSVFADGNVIANPNNPAYLPQVVTGGTLTFSEPHAVIHVGLPIIADLQTLNIDTVQGPSLMDKKKHVSRLTIFVESTRGVWAGVSEDRLTELKIRNKENYDDPVALLTGTIDINISGEWNNNGSILIRQTDPLPVSILSIVPSGFIAA